MPYLEGFISAKNPKQKKGRENVNVEVAMLKISMHAKSDPEYSYLSVAYVRDTHLAGRYQT